MKLIHLINLHRFRGGADLVAEKAVELLSKRGHEATLLCLDSRTLGAGLGGKLRAFTSGIYSPSGRRLVRETLRELRPDVIHIHDVYPLFSPWVLRDCAEAGVPVVMTCHDYRLTCPSATHACGAKVCEACRGGREYWCVLKNCRRNLFESLAYALRSVVARKNRLFLDNVAQFITPTQFAKHKLASAGFPEERISVVPYSVEQPAAGIDCSSNGYMAYLGRLSPEKGIETMLAAARVSGHELRVGGDWRPMTDVVKTAPENVHFLGELNRDEVGRLYRGARFLVFPSTWFETFGLVMAEAMAHGVPVVASNLGAVPETVEDGVTGLLFEPGNADDLARKMRTMWEDPQLCGRMGHEGRQRVLRAHTEDACYSGLMSVYERAIRGKRGEVAS